MAYRVVILSVVHLFIHVMVFSLPSIATTTPPSKNVLILIHSRTGNTLSTAEKIKRGIENSGQVHATIKRVLPFQFVLPSSDAVNAVPFATLDELSSYDALIFGSPVYFYSPSAEMMAFLQQAMALWRDQTLKDKPVTVFFSSNGNGVSFAADTLRASLRALHMEPDTLAQQCPATTLDWDAFGACVANGITKTQPLNPPIELPPVPAPVGNYKPYKIVSNLVFINQIALSNGQIEHPGIIGVDLNDEQAKLATRVAMLNVLAVLKQAVNGDLSRVKQVVEISGFFNARVGYTTHSALLNAASDLTIEFFGEQRGAHTRASVGVSSLPTNSSVELKAIFEIEN